MLGTIRLYHYQHVVVAKTNTDVDVYVAMAIGVCLSYMIQILSIYTGYLYFLYVPTHYVCSAELGTCTTNL